MADLTDLKSIKDKQSIWGYLRIPDGNLSKGPFIHFQFSLRFLMRFSSSDACERVVMNVLSIQDPSYGINYFADLRMTFHQNFFLQDWFRNKFGIGLG
jgi:hypothetical protein